jgi:hypothetical protein
MRRENRTDTDEDVMCGREPMLLSAIPLCLVMGSSYLVPGSINSHAGHAYCEYDGLVQSSGWGFTVILVVQCILLYSDCDSTLTPINVAVWYPQHLI